MFFILTLPCTNPDSIPYHGRKPAIVSYPMLDIPYNMPYNIPYNIVYPLPISPSPYNV